MGPSAELANQFSNGIFDLLRLPGALLGDLGELIWVSVALGVGVALVFRLLVDQPRLDLARDRLRAALLELWLFRHDPVVVLRAEARLLAANVGYLWAFLVPLAVATLLVTPLLIQIHGRWGLQPALPNQPLLITAELEPGADPHMVLEWATGQGAVLPPVRVPAQNRLVWRVEPAVPGHLVLALRCEGHRAEVPLLVGGTGEGISSTRTSGGLAQLLHPRQKALEEGCGLRQIEVDYLRADSGWLFWLSVVSLAAAWAVNALAKARAPRLPRRPN